MTEEREGLPALGEVNNRAERDGCEAAERGLDQGEEPNAYGVELGELFEALGL